tara:strand:- start:54 stop:731 length:678 start_codon:yes stop_codon:yes gene_type:complete
MIGFMKVHDAGSKKLKLAISKNLSSVTKGNFRASLFGGDLRNGAFWRIKTNEKIIKGNEIELVNNSIKKKNRLSYLIFLNRYHHSLNLIFYLFDIKLSKVKNFNLSKIDNFSFKIKFQYRKIYFDLNFGNSSSKKWVEFYNFKSKDTEYLLELESPFNVQNSGRLFTKKGRYNKIYSNYELGYSWSFKNQLEYFLKNLKKEKLINNIESCYKEQIFLEKNWRKLK